VVGETKTRRLVAAQVRVDDVHRAHEVLEDLTGVRVAQVERDRLLVAIEGLEEERALALLERRDIAADVAAGRRVLELDHLRAEIGELERAPGTGAELLDGQDADVCERKAHAAARSSSICSRNSSAPQPRLRITCCAPASAYSRTRAAHSSAVPAQQ